MPGFRTGAVRRDGRRLRGRSSDQPSDAGRGWCSTSGPCGRRPWVDQRDLRLPALLEQILDGPDLYLGHLVPEGRLVEAGGPRLVRIERPGSARITNMPIFGLLALDRGDQVLDHSDVDLLAAPD